MNFSENNSHDFSDRFSQPDWGHSVEARRKKQGWSQQVLATRAGVSIATVKNIAGGMRVGPETIDKIESSFAKIQSIPPMRSVPDQRAISPSPVRRSVSWESHVAALGIVFNSDDAKRDAFLDRLTEYANRLKMLEASKK